MLKIALYTYKTKLNNIIIYFPVWKYVPIYILIINKCMLMCYVKQEAKTVLFFVVNLSDLSNIVTNHL